MPCPAETQRHGDVLSHAGREFGQNGKFGHALRVDAPAQQRLSGLQEMVERARPPPLGGFALARGAVFPQRRLAFGGLPTEHPAFVDRMQGVDQSLRAADRQSRRDQPLAEPAKQIGLGRAGQSGGGDPGRQLCKLRVVHYMVFFSNRSPD